MYIRPRITIRTKILFVLSAVVIAAVALYLYLATKLFYEDKTLLVYELNQTNVRTLGEETETYLKRILDKMKILASLQAQSPTQSPLVGSSVLDALSAEEDGILRIGRVTRNEAGVQETQVMGEWLSPLTLVAKDARYLDELRVQAPIPFTAIFEKGVWVKNVTPTRVGSADSSSQAIAVMTLAMVAPDHASVIFADVKLDHLLQLVARNGIAKIYLTDSTGMTLAHPDSARVLQRFETAADPLMHQALVSKVRSEVKQFESDGKKYLGSFYKLSTGGVIAASEIEADEAFTAAKILIQKSLGYALMAVTAAFLIALFLSHSLTVPIQKMVEATQRIADGDFKSKVPVSTGDELAQLAKSFNSMTEKIQIAQEQLVHSERMAAIGQVARSIGHEFGNILLAIVGNADLAMSSGDTVKVQGNLKTILQAADRATLIVRNLQSFSKSSASRAPTEPTALIRATLSLLQHEINKNSVVVTETSTATRLIEVSAAEVEQVLLNLVINAIHSMPQGGKIEIGSEDHSEKQVRLWVKDSGTGISPEVLPKIFDYAFTTKGSKGSGLGLAISKQIVENHSGQLTVETRSGEGTKFTLTFEGIT